MNREEAKEIIIEHILRSTEFRLERFLFNKQLSFVQDPTPFKTAVCSRRAGKTIACAAHLIDTCLKNPDTVSLYITLSRNNAKKIVWREIERLNVIYGLKGVPDQTELSMSFPNKSILYLSGAKDKSEIQKFRGLPIKLAYVDEAQSFRPYLQELLDDIVAPALMDYAGTMCLIGTPGPIPAGYFYDCSMKLEAWSKHAWTFWDNPFIASKSGQTHQQLLERELKRRGVTADDPSIQREWFGRWAFDSDSLLIRYQPDKNDYQTLPNRKWNYILGIDLGYDDADALVVLAWSESSRDTYLVHEVISEKQGLTELVDQIQELQRRYDIAKMVIDEGGLGKKIAEEIRRRKHIPVQPADKARKMENVAFLNDALRRGDFKAKKTSRFAQDSYLLEIDKEKTTPDRIRVKDSFHSDVIDAALYAFRESPAYTYQEPVVRAPVHTPEWQKEEEDLMEEAALEHFTRLQDEENEAKNWGW